MNKAFEELRKYLDKTSALFAAMALLDWDAETLAPEKAPSHTSEIIGSLSEQYRDIITDEHVKMLIEQSREDGLSETEAGILRAAEEEIERIGCIPADEYKAFAMLTARASHVWARARKNNDFDAFAPTLQKIVDYEKKFASYRAKKGQKLYDVMLDTYEKGFDTATLDPFFKELKERLIPLIEKSKEASMQIRTDFLSAGYPVEAQEKAARLLVEYVGFDMTKGVLAVSAHPFTTNLHNQDVRITTHYGENIEASLFSAIHEAGHAIYEFGIGDDLTLTPAGQGASMGMHESQSRFFENIIGRNEAFWEPIYPQMTEIFGEPLKSVSLSDFLKAVNKVTPGLIRTNADELTYPLHVLVRYEIEKMLIEDNLPVKELPEIWNRKYEEYLGVRPANDSEGILQDIHWSQGSFGYFPSYALGSAFAAQIYYQMKKEMDFDGLLREGQLSVIREYLEHHIHRYGKLKSSREFLKEISGEDFSPKYYIEYLEGKYGK